MVVNQKKWDPKEILTNNAVWHKKLTAVWSISRYVERSDSEAAAKQPIQFLLQLLSLWFYWRKSESEHKFWQSKKPKKSLEFALFFFFFSPEFWNFFTYQHVTYYNNNSLYTNMHQEMMPFFHFKHTNLLNLSWCNFIVIW